jgi:GT2 family glycosyltransferase
MKTFAIVVTHNAKKWCDKCLGSLKESEVAVQTIVIDNASTDGTAEYIKSHFPEIHLIESNTNLGFARANNIAIKYSLEHDADYFFLLNQDAWIEKNTLSGLIKTFENNQFAGIVSPMHLNGSYTGLDRNFVTYLSCDLISDLFQKKLKSEYELPFINAASWLISKNCINKVGGFDTLLFTHTGEDDNYCQRVLYHGFRIIVNTSTTICHDRENREQEEQKLFSKLKSRKVQLGNVNLDDANAESNIKNLKRLIYRSIIKNLICFKFKIIKELISELKLFSDIKESRTRNKKGNGIWL